MDIVVANRQRVEQGIRLRRSWALVSISDPDRQHAVLPLALLQTGVLRLQFDDAAPGDAPLDRRQPLRQFTAADARAVWSFVSERMGRVDTLVVQCEAGWSRSPAIAAAISLSIGEDASRFFRDYGPNVHVFRRMLDHARGHLQHSAHVPEGERVRNPLFARIGAYPLRRFHDLGSIFAKRYTGGLCGSSGSYAKV